MNKRGIFYKQTDQRRGMKNKEKLRSFYRLINAIRDLGLFLKQKKDINGKNSE
jgi:hypothetical protein